MYISIISVSIVNSMPPDIVIIIFLYTAIIFDDFENEFNKKLIKIMIVTGIISFILLEILPGKIF